MALKVGISGLRGTVEDGQPGLTPDLVVAYTAAFAAWLRGQGGETVPLVAVGRDGRRSSPMLAALVRGTLLAAGCRVADLGLTLTPTVQFFVSHTPDVRGGVMVTASHNPLEWNGLKFLDANGRFLDLDVWTTLKQRVEAGDFPWVSLPDIPGASEWGQEALTAHRQAVLAAVSPEAVRRARLRVALDACNSGAVHWIPAFEELGCEVVACHTEHHGFFARHPEPLPQHLETLCALVRRAGCHVGFAADPDGDRLVLVDERGNPVSEEHTVVLCARERVRHRRGAVVVNVVTTHALEDALPHVPVHRTPVGEMHVVNGVLATDAVLGGEGSGGIIVPDVHLARDGLAAAALVLNLLAHESRPLSALVAEIPAWHSVKMRLVPEGGSADDLRTLFAEWQSESPAVHVTPQTVRIGGQRAELCLYVSGATLCLEGMLPDGRSVRGEAAGEDEKVAVLVARLAAEPPTVDLRDGIKLSGSGAWLSLRPSNTEPILRLMGEIRGEPHDR